MKKLCFLVVVLTIISVFSISCDSAEEAGNNPYVNKIAIPTVGELPDFTADMGIIVRDSIDAETFLDSMLKVTISPDSSHYSDNNIFGSIDNSIQSGISWVANEKYQDKNEYKLENEKASTRYNKQLCDLDIIEYRYCETKLFHISETFGRKEIETFSRVRFLEDCSDEEFTTKHGGIVVYKGSLRNLWTRSGGEISLSSTRGHSMEVLVKIFTCAYIVSYNGFCAKMVMDYIYFRDGEYPSEGTVRVYGNNNQELLVRKITRYSDIYKFIDENTYVDYFQHNF